ncbi:Lipoate-protein ligase LplJ [Rosistilla carotiformis]|uniref:Lipoate-protein ligase LplJ n=1 Tax=Rosistilla carotiformis TaxID=2528017 RepID=A0A518JZT9_9BACT|nr:lipoate--protein ligase family protein [Rosistilla carotiformis]QDV71060.1 Lipoate-protein ligase LplJ [Rosistilla carotiformis]
MRLLDLSFPEGPRNLALDEALLESADATGRAGDGEVLRLWKFDSPTVVVGRGSKVADEVNREFCERVSIPILRRCSGGTSVTVGPGCLLYSLVLSTDLRPQLKDLDQVHQFVMQTIREAIGGLLGRVQFQGTCDLTWQNRKFSGNSLRVARRHVLYHGTLLYDFPIDLVQNTLRVPPRQPDYRGGRTHDQFVINLPLGERQLRNALGSAFGVQATLQQWPEDRVEQLVASRYGNPGWNFRH